MVVIRLAVLYVAGSHLQVCEYLQATCCSSEMESTLRVHGRSELVRAIADRIVLAKQIFLSRAAKFDGSSNSVTLQGGPKKLPTAFFAINLPTINHFSYVLAHVHYRKFATE